MKNKKIIYKSAFGIIFSFALIFIVRAEECEKKCNEAIIDPMECSSNCLGETSRRLTSKKVMIGHELTSKTVCGVTPSGDPCIAGGIKTCSSLTN